VALGHRRRRAFGAAVYFIAERVRHIRARRAIDNVISSVAFDELRNVLLPTGAGDQQIHVNYLLLTQKGLLLIDLFDVHGVVFAGEKMAQWSIFGPKRHFMVSNPLPMLYDRVAAVRHFAGDDVAVEGRVVFSMRGEFPKGRPEVVIRLDEAAGRIPCGREVDGRRCSSVRRGLGENQAGRAAEPARALASRTLSNAGGQAARCRLSLAAWSASTWATQPVSLRAVSMCRNSFGPCALEFGPSTPVTRNCVPGKRSPSIPMNGMLPPVPMYIESCPKKACDACCIDCSSHGANVGAFQPPIADSTLNSTRAP
jgi:hypothetical protein